jgi:hypothetical protein
VYPYILLMLQFSNCTNTVDIMLDVPDIMLDVPITVFFFTKNPSGAYLVLFQDTFWPQ